MKLKRLLILAIVFLLSSLSSYAVLKGDDVNETVIMLSSELEVFSEHVDATINEFLTARNIYKDKVHEFRKEMASAKLSLYSQQEQKPLSLEDFISLIKEDIKSKKLPKDRQ